MFLNEADFDDVELGPDVFIIVGKCTDGISFELDCEFATEEDAKAYIPKMTKHWDIVHDSIQIIPRPSIGIKQ